MSGFENGWDVPGVLPLGTQIQTPSGPVALNPPIGAVIDKGGFGWNLKGYGAVGDGIILDDAAIALWAAAGHNLQAPTGVYLTSGFTLPVVNQLRVRGAGAGNTIFKPNGAIDVMTMPVGALYGELDGFTIDGNGVANHGIYAPANTAIGWKFDELEIVNCTGTPGTGFEAVNSSYAMDFRRCKINANNIGVRLTKACQFTNFWSTMIYSNNTAEVILGDNISTMNGPISFHGCEVEHLNTNTAQDDILAYGVQPLIVSGMYCESPLAGSTCIRLSGTLPTNLVVNGMFGAGAAVCPNPIVIDAGAGASTVSLDGYQFNGYTGAPIVDNSTGSAWTQFPGRNSGGKTDMTFSERVFITPPAGTTSPLLKVNAPAGTTGHWIDFQFNGVSWVFVDENGLLTIKTPANAGGVTQSNGGGSGIAYWRNALNFGHNFEQGASGSSTSLMRISQYGQLIANFSGTPPVGAALGTNVASITPTGNDFAGFLTVIITGAGTAAAADLGTMAFKNAYPSVPRQVMLIDQTSGNTTTFKFTAGTLVAGSYHLKCEQALAAGTYIVGYISIGAS